MYKPSPHLILRCFSVSVSHPSLPVEGVRNESESSKVAEKRRQAGVGNECLNPWFIASLNAYVRVQVKLRVRRRLRPNSRSSRLGEAFLLQGHTLPFRHESGRCRGGFTFAAFVSVFPGCVSGCIDNPTSLNTLVYFPPSLYLSFSASGTVYTAMDVATGQEVSIHHQLLGFCGVWF